VHFDLKQLAVHVQKVLPKHFVALEGNFAFALNIQHHEANFVFLLLRAIVDDVRVADVVLQPDELVRDVLKLVAPRDDGLEHSFADEVIA
jgi:hypothetical protein